MRKVGQPLVTSMVQPISHGMVKFMAPQIICEGLGDFKVFWKWT